MAKRRMHGFRRPAKPTRASRRRAAPFRCRLVVMAKAPVAGRVKTRLARELGAAFAVRFSRHGLAALLGRVGHDPRWRTTLAVAPDAEVAGRFWPRGIARIAQGDGDLGARMQRIFDRQSPGPVVIVGTDVPGIDAALIARAFCLLGRHDAVFGPATDGGYWLIGLKRRPRVPKAFARVRWSSVHALADTMANLAGRSVATVASLADVDDAADLAGGAASFARRICSLDMARALDFQQGRE